MTRGIWTLADYLDITVVEAETQWRGILSRQMPSAGARQVDFLPVETLLCAAARLVVGYTRLGSGTIDRAGPPIPQLGTLFRRRASSVVAKMHNLDGSRPNGAKNDLEVGLRLGDDLDLLAHIYRTILTAARNVGIPSAALPDFLLVEAGGTPLLLGQEELDTRSLDHVMAEELPTWRERTPEQAESATERYLMQHIRISQHRFAQGVLANCGNACIFCGFSLVDDERPTLLTAGHIKPWRDSDTRERLDVANGIAACPTHDAAFDAGLITIEGDSPPLRLRLSPRLQKATTANDAAARYFGGEGIRQSIILPDGAVPPSPVYLDWHQERVFA